MRALGASRTSVVPGGALAGNWARNALWKTARAVPSLDLRFAENKTLGDAVGGGSLVSFTRASSATFTGSDGLIKSATTNEPRFDHDPTTGESLGLLVEEARTNLLLNSATLSTQSVTVAAAANTLSFYGTGTVTLTGVSTAGPLVGTGANNRVSLTFTPTVGVLVLTVSGSVTNAQLEAGAFPTSYIPTTTATVTRAADVASITGSNFSSWYRQDEGTLYAAYSRQVTGTATFAASLTETLSASSSNRIQFSLNTSNVPSYALVAAGTTQGTLTPGGTAPNYVTAYGYKLDDVACSSSGSTVATDTTAVMPTGIAYLNIGSNPASASGFLNGTIKRLTYWPVRLANPTLQAITSP
jgi:hypothetical protein